MSCPLPRCTIGERRNLALSVVDFSACLHTSPYGCAGGFRSAWSTALLLVADARPFVADAPRWWEGALSGPREAPATRPRRSPPSLGACCPLSVPFQAASCFWQKPLATRGGISDGADALRHARCMEPRQAPLSVIEVVVELPASCCCSAPGRMMECGTSRAFIKRSN